LSRRQELPCEILVLPYVLLLVSSSKGESLSYAQVREFGPRVIAE
jgi:hypothetical protein